MATIKISRSREYINALRKFQVFIDGEAVCSLRNGETRAFSVSGGRHTVRAGVDWCSSPEVVVDVDDGQAVELKVGGFKYSRILIPIGLGIFLLHVLLSMFTDIEYVIYFVVPIVFLLFYYISFGKREYLTLSELNITNTK